MDKKRLCDFFLTVVLIISFYLGIFSLPVKGILQPLHMSDYTAPLGLEVRPHDYRYTNVHLNLREGPGTNNPILATIPPDTTLDVFTVRGDWGRVYHLGQSGYVHLGYLRRERERPKPVVPVSIKPDPVKPDPVVPKPKPPSEVKPAPLPSSKVVQRGVTVMEQRTMAITIDAGWLFEEALDILDVLDRFDIKATFFLRAYWVRDNPQLAREIQSRGHVIGNHSTTHGHMAQMTEAEIRWEFTEAKRIFKEVLGQDATLFRPPFGEYDDRVLRIAGEQGFRYTVMWSIDTHDWAETLNNRTVDVEYIIERVMTLRQDRDIVLMHVAFDKTPRALEILIPQLKEKGIRFVTLNEVLP